MKIRLWRIAVILLITLTLILNAAPVNAADYQYILSVKAFHNLLEIGDMLVVFHYDLHYDVLPATPANLYYHFRLMDTTGSSILAATSPYPYYSGGFEEGAGSFYFSAMDAPVWGNPYILKISGNPEYHTAPIPTVTYTLMPSDYSQLSTQEENQTLLGNYVLEICHSLQTDWALEMTLNSDLGEVLTTAAESYVRGTIPNIQYMSPQIFAVQSVLPDVPTDIHPGTAKADTYTTRYTGTFVGDILEGSIFGIPGNVITGFGLTIIALIIFIFSARFFQTTIPGLVASYALFLMGFLMGFVAPAIFGVTTLLAAIYTGYIVFFRNAAA